MSKSIHVKNQPISFGKKNILTKSVNEVEYADWGWCETCLFFYLGKIWGAGGGFKIHQLGAVNKGRWEGGGNDKRGPLATVPGDWRPAMHRQGGRGGGTGETIKRRRERQRKQHSEHQPSPIPKAYRSLLQFATESDFQPHSLLLTGAEPVFGFWSVFFLSRVLWVVFVWVAEELDPDGRTFREWIWKWLF
jgi:hypothetical protein